MSKRRILTNYLLQTMLQAVVIAMITAVLRQSGVETGYASGIGIALILIIGISSACWGIWHLLFFYVDGSFPAVDLPAFLSGLFVNCFILSALYAYSKSLWICVMTHALINALSQIAMSGSAVMMDDMAVTADDISVINVVGKVICVVLAVGLHRKATLYGLHKSDRRRLR